MKLVEYFIRQVISDGIQRLRDDPSLMDGVFEDLLYSPLDVTFGKKILDEIKCFFTSNDIPVRSAFSQNEIVLPSITTHLLSSQEAPQYKSMEDHIYYERVPKDPTVLLGPFNGTSYDATTGQIAFSKTLDMTQFIQGRSIFSAEDDAVFTILGAQSVNETGTPVYSLQNQYITVVDEDGEIPDRLQCAKMYLLSSVDFYLSRVAGTWVQETFEIRINAATNSDQAIWLYYITLYVLLRNKEYFEQVGLESLTYGANDFSRDSQKMPNSIWGRTIRLTFMVQHTWSEKVDVLELYGIDINAQSNVVDNLTLVEI